MQIKPTVTSHLSELPSLKSLQIINAGKRNPPTLLVAMQVNAAIMENNMEGPQKAENRELPHDPAIPFLGIKL